MRRVAIGGVIGGLPGMLIAVVPLLLSDAGVISSDASQIGFIGIPLLFIGVMIGMAAASSNMLHRPRILGGASIGFVVGLAGGIILSQAIGAGGMWLLIVPAGMIAGGVLGVWSGERRDDPGTAAPQH